MNTYVTAENRMHIHSSKDEGKYDVSDIVDLTPMPSTVRNYEAQLNLYANRALHEELKPVKAFHTSIDISNRANLKHFIIIITFWLDGPQIRFWHV